jgi:hypothetical protein
MTDKSTTSPVREARSAGEGFVHTRVFEILARAGFVARGLVYGIIGLLALDLAVGTGGKLANQKGALRTIEHQPFGHVLLTLVAIGLGGYSLWRLVRAALGHGPEGSDTTLERLGGFGSGIVYAVMCALAVEILLSSAGSSGGAKKTTKDVFALPAGHWIIGGAGLVLIGVGIYQFVRGVRQKFLDDSKTEQMRPEVKKWFTRFGTVGHVSRAIILALVGIFLLKAAIDYKADEAIGLDGALAKVYDQPYGPWLLGAVALGLLIFGLFSIGEARYRKI